MPGKLVKTPYDDLTYRIIGSAMAIHRKQGSSRRESAYLAVTGCPVGLLLNFGTRSLQKRRIFPPKNISEHTVNRQWLFGPDWLKAEQ